MLRYVLAVGLLLGILCMGLVVETADAGRITDDVVLKMRRPQPGYVTVVCSTWVNSTNNSDGYITVDAPTGYYINEFNIQEAVPNAAQTVNVLPWYSATDSTSITSAAWTQALVSGGSADHWFPVRCYKLSFTGVDDTDDLRVYAYCVKGAAGVVASETDQN